MAILGNVEITISSGGKTVQEYQPSADDDAALNAHTSSTGSSTIVKYIEAIPGANFQIDYALRGKQSFNGADYFSFSSYVDGLRISSPILKKEEYRGKYHRDFKTSQKGSKSGAGSQWTIKPLCWKELSTTDQKPDATMDKTKQKYEQLGTIKVEVTRKKLIGKTDATERVSLGLATFDDPIPEKALKGRPVNIGVSLGKEEQCQPSTIYNGEMIDENPIAVFIFLYRSKHALQILDILPRSPSPVPLEERDPDTLTREEAVELLRRKQVIGPYEIPESNADFAASANRQVQAELEAAQVKIKKEKAEENVRTPASLKREALADDDEELSFVANPSKRRRNDTETIELSD